MAKTTHSAGARVLTAAVAALLLGACGGTSTPSTTTAASTPSAAAPAGTSVGVVETEFSITLDKPSLTAGNYTFNIQNKGKFPHNLIIEGPGLDKKKSATVQGGGSGTLSVALQAGSYEMWCGVDSHKAKGMDMKITVG
jgi:plastocyanin